MLLADTLFPPIGGWKASSIAVYYPVIFKARKGSTLSLINGVQVLETQGMPIRCLHGFCSKWEQFEFLGSCLCLLALLWGTVSEAGWPSRTVLSFSFAICLMVVSVYVFKIPIWITWTKEIKSSGKTGKELFCRIAKEGKTWCKGQLEGIKSNVAALSFPVIELASKDQQHETFWYLKFHVNLNTDFYESHFSTASKKGFASSAVGTCRKPHPAN